MSSRPRPSQSTVRRAATCPSSAAARRLIVGVALLLCATLAPAATYYVDKDARGTPADGLTWATAWVRFADIQWGSGGVGAGDTLYISGGTTTKTYTERLIVKAEGTVASRLTISGGTQAGHNGSAVIDGEYQRAAGVMIDGRDYITVRKLEFRRSINGNDGSRGDVYVRSATGVTVDSCILSVERAHGGVFLNGYGTPCRDSIVRNCTITTPAAYLSGQTDGIYCQYDINSLLENNTIIIRNSNAVEHCDAIQSFISTAVTIRNNYCEQDNDKGANAQGIFLSNAKGISRIYNNVCVGVNATSSLLKYRVTDGSTGGVRIYNNTVIGGQYFVVYSDSSDMEMKNNIIYCTGAGVSGISPLRFGPSVNIRNPALFDNNLIFSENSSDVVLYGGSGKSWSEWRALGFDAHGLSATPRLGSDNRPTANSPAIDQGANLTSVGVTTDLDGVARPQGNAFDIGAFEYGDGTPTPPTPSPLAAPSGLNVAPLN